MSNHHEEHPCGCEYLNGEHIKVCADHLGVGLNPASAISDIHGVAIANVSGALVDSGVVVPEDETRYGEAVRKIMRERDEARALYDTWRGEAEKERGRANELRESRDHWWDNSRKADRRIAELEAEVTRLARTVDRKDEQMAELQEHAQKLERERDDHRARADGLYDCFSSHRDALDEARKRIAEFEAALRIAADALTRIGSGHTVDRYGADAHVKKRGCGCRDIYQGVTVTFVPCRAHDAIDGALSGTARPVTTVETWWTKTWATQWNLYRGVKDDPDRFTNIATVDLESGTFPWFDRVNNKRGKELSLDDAMHAAERSAGAVISSNRNEAIEKLRLEIQRITRILNQGNVTHHADKTWGEGVSRSAIDGLLKAFAALDAERSGR